MPNRTTARWIIILLMVAGLAWVQAILHGRHYYRLTYATCESNSALPLCGTWNSTALFQTIVVLAIGAALLLWNERRPTT